MLEPLTFSMRNKIQSLIVKKNKDLIKALKVVCSQKAKSNDKENFVLRFVFSHTHSVVFFESKSLRQKEETQKTFFRDFLHNTKQEKFYRSFLGNVLLDDYHKNMKNFEIFFIYLMKDFFKKQDRERIQEIIRK